MNVNEQVSRDSEFDEVEYCRFYSVLESPFSHEFDCSKFYTGANRQSVLEDIIIQARKDRPLIFVRAESGSGKTAMCRMVSEQLGDSLCLYVNNSGRSRTVSLERQLAEGLLLDAQVFMPITHVEAAVMNNLATHERVVILLEGVSSLSQDDFIWLRELQQKASDFGSAVVLLFMYNSTELDQLSCLVTGELQGVASLDSLTEYEVYEYLNDHMASCGQTQALVFPRDTAALIAKESKGNFAKVNRLANATLRRAFRRQAQYPADQDVPIKRKPEAVDHGTLGRMAAFLTARNAVLAGAVSGGLMLALIWSVFGESNLFELKGREAEAAFVSVTPQSEPAPELLTK